MGFGTQFQVGNRMPGMSLADLFRQNIGSPQPPGQIQQPTKLVDLIQNLLGAQSPMNQIQEAMPQMGPTPLSAVTAQPAFGRPSFGGGNLDVMPRQNLNMVRPNSLANPFGSAINQRFIR